MRLAQAARKLGITTEDIVSFLEKKEITIVKDSNTKLDESAVALLYGYFGVPEEKETAPIAQKEEDITPIVEETVVVQVEEREEEIVETSESKVIEAASHTEIAEVNVEEKTLIDTVDVSIMEKPVEDTPIVAEALTGKKYKTVSDLLEEQENAIETSEETDEIIIKAPKVNLKGLNVVGKIDLPEPKEKKVSDSDIQKEKPQRSTRTDKNRSPKKFQKGGRKKELNPQELRDRERRKADSKRRAEEAAKKKQREAYYTENILAPKQKVQKKKQAKKKTTQTATNTKKPTIQPKPKTVLGKFWRWLNT